MARLLGERHLTNLDHPALDRLGIESLERSGGLARNQHGDTGIRHLQTSSPSGLARASAKVQRVAARRLGLVQDLLDRPLHALAVQDATVQGLKPGHPVAPLPLGTTEDLEIIGPAVHDVHELSVRRRRTDGFNHSAPDL